MIGEVVKLTSEKRNDRNASSFEEFRAAPRIICLDLGIVSW